MKTVLLAQDAHTASTVDYIFLAVIAVVALAVLAACVVVSRNFNKWIQAKVKNWPGDGKPD